MNYLVMRLYAPLSSWGALAVGEDRPTASYPTRGAILGLLGAALGLKRTDTKQLQDLADSIGIASKTYSAGTILRDYHTIQTPAAIKGTTFYTRKQELQSAKLETILSSRDYREDGLWIVAIWLTADMDAKDSGTTHNNDTDNTTDNNDSITYQYTLEQLQQALKHPVFTLYLGRKSCPLSLPLSPSIVIADNIKEALDVDINALTFSRQQSEETTNLQAGRDNKKDNKDTHSNITKNQHKRFGKTNELLEQIVSDKWLPTTLVYSKTVQPNTEGLTIESNHEANAISKRLRQVTYHWEGDKKAMFAGNDRLNHTNTDTVYTHSHWDEPTNRQQWQFTQRIGHEWTTLEPVMPLIQASVSVPLANVEDNTL